MIGKHPTPSPIETAEEQIDRLVKGLRARTGGTYSENLAIVLQTHPALRKAWLQESRGRGRK